MFSKDDIKRIQSKLNEKLVKKLSVDGDAGPKTIAALFAFMGIKADANPSTVVVVQPSPIYTPKGDTPWMDWMTARIGWGEKSHEQELAGFWKLVGLKFKDIIGRSHAWCAMCVNAALEESGYKGNGRADAVSFEKYGTPCGYVRGAIISMRHASGGHHVTFFDHWVDEKNKIAACLGGNQGDMIKISQYNLSGNASGHDECKSPRWPVKA